MEGRDGGIAAERLVEVLGKSLEVLRDLDAKSSDDGKPAIHWYVTKATSNSPLTLTLEAHVPAIKRGTSRSVVKSYLRGIRKLESGKGVPADFGDENYPTTINTCLGEILIGQDFITRDGAVAYDWTRITRLDGAPAVTAPVGEISAPGSTVELSAQVPGGYDTGGPLVYRWRRDGADIADGPGGAGGKGVVSGSGTGALSIAGVSAGDAGAYAVLVSIACGETLSDSAQVSVETPCTADFNQDAVVNSADVSDSTTTAPSIPRMSPTSSTRGSTTPPRGADRFRQRHHHRQRRECERFHQCVVRFSRDLFAKHIRDPHLDFLVSNTVARGTSCLPTSPCRAAAAESSRNS